MFPITNHLIHIVRLNIDKIQYLGIQNRVGIYVMDSNGKERKKIRKMGKEEDERGG
jgi:hypothetical protein